MLVYLCSQGIKVTKKDQNSLVLVLLKKYEKKNIQKTVLLGILQIIGFFVKIHCFFVLSGVLY